ncbi:MAG: 3-phosphoshikimate 1-carboxyvinyltransferase [Acidobacteriota bacterium]
MSRNIRIRGNSKVIGTVQVPGDKSISHRVAMLASIAEGCSTIQGFASSADCHATLDCIKKLGIAVVENNQTIEIHGRGLRGYQPAKLPVELFVGNSGSTIRMLSGILAGQNFQSIVDGDASIRRRPMKRIIEPLTLMGATITATEGNFAPLTIHGNRLRPIDYHTPVASAQVKTCVLFAGIFADGETTVSEPELSRNHSELMLKEFGAKIETLRATNKISIQGQVELHPVAYQVPGDVSSAAFLIAAALLLPDSQLLIKNINLNPTRTAFLNVLENLGATIIRENITLRHMEPVGDLRIFFSELKTEKEGMVLSGDIIPNLIDEIPILAVIATQIAGRLKIRDARELRIKESDRLKTVTEGLRAMGVEVDEFEDGLAISGKQTLKAAKIHSEGDHRIAMAFTIAGLLASGETEIIGADCAAVSFPEFYELLTELCGEGTIIENPRNEK